MVNCDPSQGVAYEPDFVHYTLSGNITVGNLVGNRILVLDAMNQ